MTNDTTLAAAARAVAESLLETPPDVLPPLPMMKTIGSPSVEHYLTNMRQYVSDLIVEARLEPDARIFDSDAGTTVMFGSQDAAPYGWLPIIDERSGITLVGVRDLAIGTDIVFV